MLTGSDDVVDRIVGLEVGADDYLTKPFDLRELRARIRAVLRRGGLDIPDNVGAAANTNAACKLVPFGKVALDTERHCLVSREGEALRLTASEFDMLSIFAANPNRVISRERLLDNGGAGDDEPFDRAIDIRIARIRKKIEVDPATPQVIKTIRGAGYIFVPPRG
jgi:two-component system OmpR family response regulator